MECQKCILGYSRVIFGLNKETNKITFFLMVSVNTVGSEDISPEERNFPRNIIHWYITNAFQYDFQDTL